ncbi:CynX/NimT family MFS transporter [Spelaeicoccus albus]|uniref:CP family cyanate transporter-like MFS transporter n=1 Tax=Spelaeicoccus albus TaxID=1280376 RepID=A0A7Z0D2X7_9MICO|nr:MFS transporter [Spelaeicoccus albus]NYI67887.1 CP family cyanate transporter-like MFS transporter [Spelaeicoccus albus]
MTVEPAPARILGSRRWLLVIGIMVLAANLRCSITSVGPVLDFIAADLHMSSGTAGLLTSIPLLGFAAFSPIAPLVAARWGMERTLWAAVALLGCAIVLRSVPAPGMIWAGTVGLGGAIAFINVLLPPLLKRDFPNRIGQLTGIYSAVQGGVAALASGIAVPMAGADGQAWRLSLGIWAGLALIGLAVFAPQLAKRSAPPTGATGIETVGAAARYRSPWGSALAWQVTIFMGVQSMMFFVTAAWVPSIEQAMGGSATRAGWHLFLFQLVGLLTSLLTSTLIHRVRDQRGLCIAGTLCSAVEFTGILLFPQAMVVWMIFAGLGSGSCIVLGLSLFGLRTEHHRQAAALSGMAQSIGYLIAACGPTMFGLLHDLGSGWTLPITAIEVCLAVQLVMATLAGRDRFIGVRRVTGS